MKRSWIINLSDELRKLTEFKDLINLCLIGCFFCIIFCCHFTKCFIMICKKQWEKQLIEGLLASDWQSRRDIEKNHSLCTSVRIVQWWGFSACLTYSWFYFESVHKHKKPFRSSACLSSLCIFRVEISWFYSTCAFNNENFQEGYCCNW